MMSKISSVYNIEEVIVKIIADHLGLSPLSLRVGMNIKEDLGADTLDLYELILTIEEIFKVEISHSELLRITFIKDIVIIVEQKFKKDEVK